MSKAFNIIIKPNASTDEITDSVADAFGVVYKVESALSDGFQVGDVLVAIQQEPTVKEVINDFPIFLSQFKELNGLTALQAVEAAKARSVSEHGDLGRIGGFFYNLLIRMAKTFNFIEGTVIAGMDELQQWKTLFGSVKKEQPA